MNKIVGTSLHDEHLTLAFTTNGSLVGTDPSSTFLLQ